MVPAALACQEFGDADLALTPLDAAHRATVQAKSLAQRALGASDHLPRTRDALTQLPGVHACDFRTRRAGRQTCFKGGTCLRCTVTLTTTTTPANPRVRQPDDDTFIVRPTVQDPSSNNTNPTWSFSAAVNTQ